MYMVWYKFWYIVFVHSMVHVLVHGMVQVLVHGLCTWYGDVFGVHASGSGYSWLISDNDHDNVRFDDNLITCWMTS
jgi:hypothetical protein